MDTLRIYFITIRFIHLDKTFLMAFVQGNVNVPRVFLDLPVPSLANQTLTKNVYELYCISVYIIISINYIDFIMSLIILYSVL